MQFFLGAVYGVFLTILAVFLADAGSRRPLRREPRPKASSTGMSPEREWRTRSTSFARTCVI